MGIFQRALGWFGFGGAVGDTEGQQIGLPSTSLVPDAANVGVDGALQISTVWSCIERRANTIAGLPMFAYETDASGMRTLARSSRLYQLAHESPNARMTPFEFWRAMMINYDLRGNAYARIARDAKGEAFALWPMAADQVQEYILPDGSMLYRYQIGSNEVILPEHDMLHIKNMGNGSSGLCKLEFMRAATDESAKQLNSASKIFGSGGKPTGVLTTNAILKPEQRAQLTQRFAEMANGNSARLFVLEADVKYSQLSMSPVDQQLLESRKFSVEEICRWFDVPPVLVHHSNVTAWGSGIEQIIDGFHKFTIAPMLTNIEQAFRKRVMTPAQRATMTVEFSHDALLRGNIKDRYSIYAQGTQNGILTRNEARQLENLPRVEGADVLTVQSNLLPIDQLGVKIDSNAGRNPDAGAQEN